MNTFNETKFITKVDNIFIMLHMALMTENLLRVKHFISNKIYQEYTDKLNNLQNKNQRQMFDELNVKSTEILNRKIINNKEIIIVRLISRYMDYIIDKDSKKLISGNNNYRVEKNNILTFEKDLDTKNYNNIKRCPNCGAVMNINNTGVCEYCKSIFNTKDYDFILTNIEIR